MVTAEGLKVKLLVAVTVPVDPAIGVDGVLVQANGNKAKRAQAKQNNIDEILFMSPHLT
jgi:hypothetical protein